MKQRLLTARIGEYFNSKNRGVLQQEKRKWRENNSKKSDDGILKYTFRRGACFGRVYLLTTLLCLCSSTTRTSSKCSRRSTFPRRVGGVSRESLSEDRHGHANFGPGVVGTPISRLRGIVREGSRSLLRRLHEGLGEVAGEWMYRSARHDLKI